MKVNFLFAILAVLILGQDSMAKEWRGIIPLRSTRADVERLFGKPNEWGRYQFKDERASIEYSSGPCKGVYQALRKDNCKCLAPKDTVLSIYVEPVQQTFSALKIDKGKYTRTPIVSGPPNFSYSNRAEGIIYTVDETEDEIIDIEYLPSTEDCQNTIKSTVPHRNSWRGLTPLHSSRNDVERLLGRPNTLGTYDVYRAENETVSVKYSKGTCKGPNVEWSVPDDTLVELTVTPSLSFLLRKLDLDLSKYERQDLFPLPEIPNPPKVVNYINDLEGITIRSQSHGGTEEVISITYRPSAKDNKFRCSSNTREASRRTPSSKSSLSPSPAPRAGTPLTRLANRLR